MTEPVKMTNEIEELEALLEKATPGPWFLVTPPWLPPDVGTWIIAGDQDPHRGKAVCDFEIQRDCDMTEGDNYYNDALLIAAARNLLPALLQSLKDKDAEIERLRDVKDCAIALSNELDAYWNDPSQAGKRPSEYYMQSLTNYQIQLHNMLETLND